MAYVPNATDIAEPLASQTVESAALEFRTLKISVNSRIAAETATRALVDTNLQSQITSLAGSITGGAVASIVTAQEIIGDGVTATYTLAASVDSSLHVDLFIDGAHQQPSSYTVLLDQLTLLEVPHVGALMLVKIGMPIGATIDDAALIIYNPAGTGAVAATVQAKLRESVSVRDFGAVGDGVTDDTSAIQAADTAAALIGADLHFIPGTYITSNVLTQTANWFGVFAGATYNTDNPVIIKKTNGNTGDNKVVQAGASNIGTYYISLTVTNPPNYYAAIYPTGAPFDTTNPDYGFYGSGFSALYYLGCTATGFRVAGFDLESGCVVSTLELCDAKWNNIGFNIASTDCQVVNSTAHHNCNQGMKVSGNYPRIINNRIEWNAYEGIWMTAGEFTVVGNIFDRNGKAGLYLDSGWGGVVTGNYFARNGVGGDGAVGRWAFSTLASGATGGYVTLAAGESCHINIKFQRAVTITSNRYRNGLSDALDGADGPAYIYRSNADSVDIVYNDNAGEYGTPTSGAGYNASYPGGAVGIMYGTAIAPSLTSNRGRYVTKYGKVDNDGAGGTIVIPITQDDTFGEVLVKWAQFPNSGVTKVTYYYSSVFGSYATKVDLVPVTGSTATSASLTLVVNSSSLTIGGYTFLTIANHNVNQL